MDKELTIHGVDWMEDKGFRGQGVNVLVYEWAGSEHSNRVADAVSYMAPEAQVFQAWFEPGRRDMLELIRFIVDHQIHIMNISLASDGTSGPFVRTLNDFVKRGLLVFCAAGNRRDRGPFGLAREVGITIGGAALDDGGRPVRDDTSGITRYLDFLFQRPPLPQGGMGTSFASPMAAGFAARILSGHGRFDQFGLYELLRELSRPVLVRERGSRTLEFRGQDRWDPAAGWGLPVYEPNTVSRVLRRQEAGDGGEEHRFFDRFLHRSDTPE